MARARKVYVLLDLSRSGLCIQGVYSSHCRAIAALRYNATIEARQTGSFEDAHLEATSIEEYRLVLPGGESRRYSILVLELDCSDQMIEP